RHPQSEQPGMLFSGLQSFGWLFRTIERLSSTLALPVAIPPPFEPWFRATRLRSSVVLPRLDRPPPRLPDVLASTVLWMTVVAPPGGVLIPPALIGAVFALMTLALTVSTPKLRRAPPTAVRAALPANSVRDTVALAPARFATPPPLAAVLPDSVTRCSTSVPA